MIIHDFAQPNACWPYHKQGYDKLMFFLKVNSVVGYGCDNGNWELLLPPKPETLEEGRMIEKRPCCDDAVVVCYACGTSFTL